MRIPLKDTLSRASIRKRLWLGAGAVTVFIGTLLVALMVTPGDPHDQGKVGLDFIAFYTAGNFVRDGKSRDLYDIRKVHTFQSQVAKDNGVDLGSAVGPWWNPPFYAWVFVPLAKLPYRQALVLWVLANVVCAAIAAAILCRIMARAGRRPEGRSSIATEEPDAILSTQHSALSTSLGRMPVLHGGWKSWALVPVLMVLSTPFIHALSHAQNTCTSLLLVTLTVVFWRKERAVAAGLIAGLLFYKPQLAAVLTSVMILSLGWRTLIGLSITGSILLLASLALPGSLHDFLYQMPRNIHFVQCDVPYLWDRHVTFKAFWRLLIQGSGAGEPWMVVTVLSFVCSGAMGIGLLRSVLSAMRSKNGRSDVTSESRLDIARHRDRIIAATIAATPLLMPFYFDYDQLLLAVPAVLFAADFMMRDRSKPLSRTDVWLLRIWPVQYAWLMLNPAVATITRVNVGVVLLAAVTSLLIVRARMRPDASIAKPDDVLVVGPILRAA